MTATETPGKIDATILDRLDDLDAIRPFPIVATRVLAECQDPSSSSITVAQVIQSDPGLSLRLLQLANSSLYGFSGAIRTVEHAIVVLGFRQVQELVLSLAGSEVFAQGNTAVAQRSALWEHSLGCATVARALAHSCSDTVPDEAFLAGIFHDVGKLVFYDLVPEPYMSLTDASADSTLIHQEQQRFGITHPQVGQRCGETWGLFEEINLAIGHHHNRQQCEDHAPLVTVIALANRLCKRWQIGSASGQAGDEEDDALIERLQIDVTSLDEIQQHARSDYHEYRQLCAG